MNESFGKVRNIEIFDDYAMASGTSQAELLAELSTIAKARTSLIAQRTSAQAGFDDWNADYQKKLAENCEGITFKAKREGCINDRAYKKERSDYYASLVNSLGLEIEALKSKEAQINEALKTGRDVVTALAGQGETEASVLTKAEAKAQAELIKTQSEANSVADSKKKNKQIIVFLVVVAILVTGFVIFKKVKK